MSSPSMPAVREPEEEVEEHMASRVESGGGLSPAREPSGVLQRTRSSLPVVNIGSNEFLGESSTLTFLRPARWRATLCDMDATVPVR